MNDKRRARLMASAIGATLESEPDEIRLTCPAGYCWLCEPELHTLTFSAIDTWGDVVACLSCGITPCAVDDCPVCQALEALGDHQFELDCNSEPISRG